MKKFTIIAAFAALSLAARAADRVTTSSVRDSRVSFAMAKGGADHTVLRPAHLTLPEGYKPRAKRPAAAPKHGINSAGFAPDATLQTSNWSILDNEDGSNWFYSQEFTTVNDWYYGASDFTIYNDRLERQTTIHFDAPEGETCNAIQPFGTITRKFFDIDDKTMEFLVYVHCITPDYTGKNYIYVVNDKGDVLERFEGYSAQFVDYGSGLNAQRRLLIGGEHVAQGKYAVDVYKKAGWSGGATKEHSFELDLELTNYSDGPAVNAYCIDGEAFYTVSHYEKPYSNGYDSFGQPTVTPDNYYTVEVYDASFQPVAKVKDPVTFVDNGYSMRTFGYFSYDDLNRSYNPDGSRKFDFIITNENYFFNSAEDTYLYGWSVFDEDNQKLAEFAGRAVDWWPLSSIKGQPEQVALYTLDEEGSAHIETYDLPACTLVAGFDDTVEDLPISTAFDRVPVAGGYDYVTGINRGYSDEAGNVIGVVAWITPDGRLDKRVNFNLGPNAEYFAVALSPMTLNPYIFNTDDGLEYLYRIKTSRGDGSQALDDVIVVADSEGREIRRFTSDNIYTTLSSCDVLYNAAGQPIFLLSYYASDYNEHFGESDINIFSLPFDKWPAGGSGTPDDPYLITSAGDFMMIAENPEACYSVARPIDFGNLPNGWTPVPAFFGTLKGNDHVLSNFYVSDSNAGYYAGLFGELNGAKIDGLYFQSPTLQLGRETNYAGVVAGFASANTDISNVVVDHPTVSGDQFNGQFGNISGYAGAYVTASECIVQGADVNLPSANDVGGIYGFATASSVASASSFEGSIKGHSAVGGIIGTSYINSYAVNCHSKATLEADYCVGGIVGDSEKRGTIDRCFAEGTVRATGSDKKGFACAGGIVGFLEPYWGGENDNPVAAKQNLSAVSVEGAGTTPTAHRIAGYTVDDNVWTPEEIAAGKVRHEEGLVTNYSTAPEAEGMVVGIFKVDGQTIEQSAVTADFLQQTLQFQFGDTPDAPWSIDPATGLPTLHAEVRLLGIESVTLDGERPSDSAQRLGTFDLQGRRYDTITSPGVYIINGRKVVVK